MDTAYKAIPQVDKEYMVLEYVNDQYEQLSVVLPLRKAQDFMQNACIRPGTKYILVEVLQYKHVKGEQND